MSDAVDETSRFEPKWSADGLIACIVQSAKDNHVLMFAWMNQDALNATLESGEMHFWSRSRQSLWHKGATSGNILSLVELRIDCDQDCLLARVQPQEARKALSACHTGRKDCFYRVVRQGSDGLTLTFKE